MLGANYHLHSTHSDDGEASVSEMCRAALEAGFTEIAFAEHLDFDRSDPAYGYLDDGAYAADVEQARREFAGRLTVRRGIEFDFRRAYGDEPRRVLDAMDLDFRMGSVHSATGVQIWSFNMMETEELEGLDLRAIQTDYFDEIDALVATGLCHVLGHFDYLYKQNPGVFERLRDAWYWARVERTLEACVARDVALEVNSHHVLDLGMGLAADEEILARYRRLGGRLVTVGTDAHRPGDVAHACDEAETALRRAGFHAVTGYDAGQPYPIALP